MEGRGWETLVCMLPHTAGDVSSSHTFVCELQMSSLPLATVVSVESCTANEALGVALLDETSVRCSNVCIYILGAMLDVHSSSKYL